jgi:hypothetical protein
MCEAVGEATCRALERLWLDGGPDWRVRPQAPRLSATGHPERRVPVLPGHLAFQLALDVFDGASDGEVRRLGRLMTDQRGAQRTKLDSQIRLYAPLISMLVQHEDRGRRRPVLEPPLQTAQVRAQPPLVDVRQGEPLHFELD